MLNAAVTRIRAGAAAALLTAATRRADLSCGDDEVRGYVVFERQVDGEPLVRVSIEEMLSELDDSARRMVLVGETHDDGLAHALECQIFARLSRADAPSRKIAATSPASAFARAFAAPAADDGARPCALSLEMIERSPDEHAPGGRLGAYLSGRTRDERELFAPGWSAAAYAPLARLARDAPRSAGLVAANPPRQHAALVRRAGPAALDDLDASQRALLPPLPYPSEPTDAYRSRLERVFAHAKSPENMMAAQALWDASMAHGLLRHLAEHPSHRVLHVCGRFHVEHFLGVVDQLWHYLYERPPSDAFRKLADDGVGERDAFRVVVCVPADFAAARADWAAVAREPMLAGLADFVVLTDVGKTAPGGVGPSGAAERAPECGGCPAA